MATSVTPFYKTGQISKGFVEVAITEKSDGKIALIKEISFSEGKIKDFSKGFFAKFDPDTNTLITNWSLIGTMSREGLTRLFFQKNSDQIVEISQPKFDILSDDDANYLESLAEKIEPQSKLVETTPQKIASAMPVFAEKSIFPVRTVSVPKEEKERFVVESALFFKEIGSSFEEIKLPETIKTIEDLLSYCLTTFGGFELSEEHRQFMSKKFLIEYLTFLKNQGLEIIFMELFAVEDQKALDHYFISGELSEELKDRIKMVDSSRDLEPPYSYMDIVKAMQEAGILIVGLDSQLTTSGNPHRFLTFNFNALKVMRDPKYKGKISISWTGVRHNNFTDCNLPGLLEKPIPGLSAITKRPSLMVQTRFDEDFEALPKGVSIPGLNCAGSLQLKADAMISV